LTLLIFVYRIISIKNSQNIYSNILNISVRQIYPRLSNWSFGTRQVDRGRGINTGGMDMESWPPISSTDLFSMFLLAKESLLQQH
jgi:hypothetical protein